MISYRKMKSDGYGACMADDGLDEFGRAGNQPRYQAPSSGPAYLRITPSMHTHGSYLLTVQSSYRERPRANSTAQHSTSTAQQAQGPVAKSAVKRSDGRRVGGEMRVGPK